MSVASEKPCGASAAIRSVSNVSVATMPGERRQQDRELVDLVEDRLLVLLQVAVVREREALERGQQPGQVADEPTGLAAGELGDVRVLLLRHDARPRGVGVVQAHEAELLGRPEDDLLGEPGDVDARASPRRRRTRRRRRARPCRRSSSRPGRRSPSSAATAAGSRPSDEPASAPEPYGETAAARASQSTQRSTSRSSGHACASRWCASSTGCACCRCVRPGIGASPAAVGLRDEGVDDVEHQAGERTRLVAQVHPHERGDLVVARAPGAQLAAEVGARAARSARARGRCARPRRPVPGTKAPDSRRRRAAARGRRPCPASSSSVSRPAACRTCACATEPEMSWSREPPVEVRRAGQRRQRAARAGGEAAAPQRRAARRVVGGLSCQPLIPPCEPRSTPLPNRTSRAAASLEDRP